MSGCILMVSCPGARGKKALCKKVQEGIGASSWFFEQRLTLMISKHCEKQNTESPKKQQKTQNPNKTQKHTSKRNDGLENHHLATIVVSDSGKFARC